MKQLRWYQREAVDSIYEYFSEMSGNPLVVCPTGAGKSLILAKFLQEMFAQWPDSRVMCLTHVKEFLIQNELELRGEWPEAPTSFWSASIGKKEVSQITFAGIASVFRHADKMGHVELIIIDEAHLVPSKGFGMYRQFIADMQRYNPAIKVVGLTATPFRLDHGLLVDGGHIFTHHCYEVDLRRLVEEGFLAPLRPKKPAGQIDLSGVHVRNHEYVASELEGAAMRVVEAALDEVVRHGADRKSWLMFCSGIKHAAAVKQSLIARGISAEMVTGETPKGERDDIVARFRAGGFRALVNVSVFTTGFNVPGVDLIAMLRSTLSASLYVQIMGRGMRLAPGKGDCLVLDFGGNIERHGPIDQVRVRKPGEREGVAPMKVCPDCEALCAISVRECPDCGHEFEINNGPSHEDTAAVRTLMSWEKVRDVRDLDVTSVGYTSHLGKSGKPSMRVTYLCGLQPVSEYICIGHGGYAGQKAIQWWRDRSNNGAVPTTVPGAVSNAAMLTKPTSIRVDFTDKYPRILHYTMPEPAVNTAKLQLQAMLKAKKIGVPAVQDIIRKYGADKIGMVPERNYEALYQELST